MLEKQNEGNDSVTTAAPDAADPSKRPASKGWPRRVLSLLLVVLVFQAGYALGERQMFAGLFGKQPVVTNSGLPEELDYSTANKVYEALKENYDGKLTRQQLEDGVKHGLAAATNDPYTVYFTAEEAKEFSDQLDNSFSGIGAQLGQDADGNVEVIAPIEGLPADRAGVKAKDIITRINDVSTSGLSVDEAVHKIRGKKGTKVTLQVVRNKSQALEFTITREDIKLPSVKSKILEDSTGYLQITTFTHDTTELARQAAETFKAKQVKGVILDLRNNPGGLLEQSVNISSLWLPEGKKVLDQKTGNQVVDTSLAGGGDILRGIPTVILINGGSASASEIVTGALRDHKAAYVIGEKSYGKGVVQDVICITGKRKVDNSCPQDELKVTVASWYRPSGKSINKKGISPDQLVKISDADAEADRDTQLQAAQAYLAGKR